jgi:uncharacterized membrane protein YoaK (UPF0700 family)
MTFLKLGNVFTSAMAGNTALLAIELGRGNIVAASRALTALLAFALGVGLATKMKRSSRLKPHAHRGFSRLLLLELIFLTCCAAHWSVSADPVEGGTVYAVILLSALSMGIQAYGCGALLAATLVRYLPNVLIWVPGAAVLFALGASEFAGKLEGSKR